MPGFGDLMAKDVTRHPLVPLRDLVIFPRTPAVRLFIGRPSSMAAVERALAVDRLVFLATQHDAAVEDPTPDQLYTVGTIAMILRSSRRSDGAIHIEVEGRERARALAIAEDDGCFMATVRRLQAEPEDAARLKALLARLAVVLDQYCQQYPEAEMLRACLRLPDPGQMADALAQGLNVEVEVKQQLLEAVRVSHRLGRVIELLEFEIEKVQLDRAIHTRVKRQMERAQREYYLQEKLKAIHKELGRTDERAEVEELRRRIEASGMSPEAREKAMIELRRLEQMPPMSAEAAVSRHYIEWLLAVPWTQRSEEIRDLAYAEAVLEADHYGLQKVKERILEYLAVRQLVETPRGSILCFVGPPGVGKTSLGRSIARATGRTFVRVSLGGIRDEAEIRGHRRTYVGAFPGQIIQMMRKAGTINPLFMLDEIDKLGADFRGDPAAALLEVLDPEQNHAFRDHYLDVEYDLSQVFFIATANVTHTIPPALLDRFEVIRIPGYTEREKVEIARRHLIPKQVQATGLKPEQVSFSEEALQLLIRGYTREAGVRNLEREIGAICRKVARRVVAAGAEREVYREAITAESVRVLLGPERYRPMGLRAQSEVGVATGLAWTEVGGEVLQIEVTLMPGSGELTLTGKLGEVMRESAQAAISYVRSRARDLGLPTDFHKEQDIHVHIPEGAIPKEGPSAGITIATALVSALARIPVRRDVALSGEITLRGRVLPIGGVKEKVLAAHRLGIPQLILPKENEKDLADLPEDVRAALHIHLVETMDEVLPLALEGTWPPPAESAAMPPIWLSSTASGADLNPMAE
jgi:ATP-dependent Lon protease